MPNLVFATKRALGYITEEGTRLIVIVTTPSGFNQAFYQSTGKSSGKPGSWFPFDGITAWQGINNWVNKAQYTLRENSVTKEISAPLYRYGTHELKQVGRQLDAFLGTTGKSGLQGKVYVFAHAINAAGVNNFLEEYNATRPPEWVMKFVDFFKGQGPR